MGNLKWYLLILILIVCFIRFLFYVKKFRNPYRLYMVFGKKGSGKSTMIAKLAITWIKKHGTPVYCTIPIPGTRLFDPHDIGSGWFEPGSLVLVDEVGMCFNNRDFKTFSRDARDWFKLQRHNEVTMYLFSQSFDVDIQIRNLTDYMYYARCIAGVLTVHRQIKRGMTIVNPDGQSEARIADTLEFTPLILQVFGSKCLRFAWVPHWIKYFDSYDMSRFDTTISYQLLPLYQPPVITDNPIPYQQFVVDINYFYG